MAFAHDTEAALVWAAALINTARDHKEMLDSARLTEMFSDHEWTGRLDGTTDELNAVRAVRARMRLLWTVEGLDTLVDGINDILIESGARPRLAKHGDWGWHLHVTNDDAPFADRMGAEFAVAVAELVRTDELARLRSCAADDCDAVLIDLSRNRSRRYCDTGNCGNRANVAAYRERRRSLSIE